MKANLIHELVTADVIATASAYATRAHIVDLFNQLKAAERERDEAREKYAQLTQLCKATEEREREYMAHAADLRGALEEVRIRAAFVGHPGEAFYDRGDGVMVPDWRDVLHQLESVVARTPAQSLGRIKAEALREAAGKLDSQCCECHDECNQDLLDEADRLEATDGR
jgi:small-conductance mechanosensitive channel